MVKNLKKYLITGLFSLIFGLFLRSQDDITVPELYTHIEILTSEKYKGRAPGGRVNKKLVRYINQDLKKSGVKKLKGGYLQPFTCQLRTEKDNPPGPIVKTWNVVGYLPGKDPIFSKEFIVLGAHYDHLGYGGPSSKASQKRGFHRGADDNASGTAALLEIAEKIAALPVALDRSVIFVAFGAEEQGLIGSRYFIENPPVPKSKIKLMINMDMVGRLNDQKHIYMGGAGTFPGGVTLMKKTGEFMGLTPIVHAGGVGGSDHVSFYKNKISVLGLHTGGHPQYHTPEDTIDLINFQGGEKVAEYIYQVLIKLANKEQELKYIDQG